MPVDLWIVYSCFLPQQQSCMVVKSMICKPQNTYCLDLHCCHSVAQFSSVWSLSCLQLFATPWTAACQASLSIANSRSLLRLMSIELVMPSNHVFLCHPLSSCSQSFPASGSFPTSLLFASGGQSIGASASVLPMNTQDWSPLGWTDWIFLQSKGLWRVWTFTEKIYWHIRNGILFSHNKECIWNSSNEVDEHRTYYTEWSKPERER